jgi:hypothetical protein
MKVSLDIVILRKVKAFKYLSGFFVKKSKFNS